MNNTIQEEKTELESIFSTLLHHVNKVGSLEQIQRLLGWDEMVMMPPESTKNRTEQKSVLANIIHQESTHPLIGKSIEALKAHEESLSANQKTIYKHTKKEYERSSKLSDAFIARKSQEQSEAYHAWVKAREQSDFSVFKPFLEKNISTAIEEAQTVGSHENIYDYWLGQYDAGLTEDTVRPIFSALKSELGDILEQIEKSPNYKKPQVLKGFSKDKQLHFCRQIAEGLGFNFNTGRLDASIHPFCSGNGSDTRITTRFPADNSIESIFSTMHETGHALYEQGLPKEHLTNPLGTHIGMSVHESQSRLWENQVGRSPEFWNHWFPAYSELFKEELNGMGQDEFYRNINHVERSEIRVNADEVTYNLHIILRYELESELISGKLKVKDLPEAWNAKSQEILGFTPQGLSTGLLQDMHWSFCIGYFPSYTMGNLIASQLWYTLKEQIGSVEASIEAADYSPILNWLRSEIHQYGKTYDTNEIVQKATGSPLSEKNLIRYLKERYLPLYK